MGIIEILVGTIALFLIGRALFRLGGKTGGSQIGADDERALRELWNRMDRLEQRLGNLETILTAEKQPRAAAGSH